MLLTSRVFRYIRGGHSLGEPQNQRKQKFDWGSEINGDPEHFGVRVEALELCLWKLGHGSRTTQ